MRGEVCVRTLLFYCLAAVAIAPPFSVFEDAKQRGFKFEGILNTPSMSLRLWGQSVNHSTHSNLLHYFLPSMHHSTAQQEVEECAAWMVLSDCFSLSQLAEPPQRYTLFYIFPRQKLPSQCRRAVAWIPAEARPDRRSPHICATGWRC